MKDKPTLNKKKLEAYFNDPHCHRCGGLMVSSFYLGEEKFVGRTCVKCGEVIDLFILINRFGLDEDDVLKIFLFPEIEIYLN